MNGEPVGANREGDDSIDWISATIRKYGLDSKPPASVAELLNLPEIAMVAFYRYTRNERGGRRLGQLAEEAVMSRYRGLIRNSVGVELFNIGESGFKNPHQQLPNAANLAQAMWAGLFEAISKYDPNRRGYNRQTASVYSYAQNYLKNKKEDIFGDDHSGPQPREEAARLYVKIREATIKLQCEKGAEPTVEEIATEVAQNPSVIERVGSFQRAFELAIEALLILRTPVESADEQPDEGDDAPAPKQIAGDFALPEATLLLNAERAINHAELIHKLAQAQRRLGLQGARQLLVLRILLGVNQEHLAHEHDPNRPQAPRPAIPVAVFNLRKIATHLRNPEPNMIAIWSWLHAAWELERCGLPNDWQVVRAWFPPAPTERVLFKLYSNLIKRSGIRTHARILDDVELFLNSFRQSLKYKQAYAAWQPQPGPAEPFTDGYLFEQSTSASIALLRFNLNSCRLIWNRECYAQNIRPPTETYFRSVRQAAGLANSSEPIAEAVPITILECLAADHAESDRVEGAAGAVSLTALLRCKPQQEAAATALVKEGKIAPHNLALSIVSILLIATPVPG